MTDNATDTTNAFGPTAKILVLVGSLRRDSVNRCSPRLRPTMSPAGVDVALYSGLEKLPFYNEDLDIDGSVAAASSCVRRRPTPTRSCSSPPNTTAPSPPCSRTRSTGSRALRLRRDQRQARGCVSAALAQYGGSGRTPTPARRWASPVARCRGRRPAPQRSAARSKVRDGHPREFPRSSRLCVRSWRFWPTIGDRRRLSFREL